MLTLNQRNASMVLSSNVIVIRYLFPWYDARIVQCQHATCPRNPPTDATDQTRRASYCLTPLGRLWINLWKNSPDLESWDSGCSRSIRMHMTTYKPVVIIPLSIFERNTCQLKICGFAAVQLNIRDNLIDYIGTFTVSIGACLFRLTKNTTFLLPTKYL